MPAWGSVGLGYSVGDAVDCRSFISRANHVDADWRAGRITREHADGMFYQIVTEMESAKSGGVCGGATFYYDLATVRNMWSVVISTGTIESYRQTTVNYQLVEIVLIGTAALAAIWWASGASG